MRKVKWNEILPFLAWIPEVSKSSLKADIMAGFTGGIIVLPQGMAFAAIAGLPPVYGLYTAVILPVIAALFSSSRHLVSGPTIAVSILVFSTVSQFAAPGSSQYITLALTLTFLTGIYQFIFGIARLGALVNFVSHTVIIGFSGGAAIIIVTSQLKYVLGLALQKSESFIHTWTAILTHMDSINYYTLSIAAVTMIVCLLSKRIYPKIPGYLPGMIAGGLTAFLINGSAHGVKYVGTIIAQLPPLTLPDFSRSTIQSLATQAFPIALLGLIMSVSVSRVFAAKTHELINADQEFISQGLANSLGSFFSCYAGSGVLSRSAVNYSSGAKTPLSIFFASTFLTILVFTVAPLIKYLPVAAMAGVILIVAYDLIDFDHIRWLMKASKAETAIFLTTFLSTLFLNLELAIYLGVFISLIVFLTRTSRPNIATLAPDYDKSFKRKILNDIQKYPLKECPQIKILRIDMSIFFGSMHFILHKFNRVTNEANIKHLLLDTSGVNFIDVSGMKMLEEEQERFKELGGGLYINGLKFHVEEYLERGGFMDIFGRGNVFESRFQAIRSILEKIDKEQCQSCTARVFEECQLFPQSANQRFPNGE